MERKENKERTEFCIKKNESIIFFISEGGGRR